MNMAVIERHAIYIAVPEHISLEAITNAQNKFMERYGYEAQEIRLGSRAYNDILKSARKAGMPVDITTDALQGLRIEHDNNIKSYEWLVGISKESTRAIK